MKYPIFALAALLSTQAAATELSKSQLEKVEASIDASVVQIMLPHNCRGVEKKEKFQEQVVEEVKGKYPELAKAFETGKEISVAGTQIAIITAGGAGSSAQSQKNAFNFRFAEKLTKLSNSAVGLGVMSSMNILSAEVGERATGPSSTKVLNADQMDEFAKKLAKDTAQTFSLGLDEEATLRGAIKTAVSKKFRNKDESPIDYFEVLKDASFRGKAVFSGEKMLVLDKMRAAASDKASAGDSSPHEKIAALAVATTALENCLSGNDSGQNPYKTEAVLRVAKNKETLAQVAESLEHAKAEKSSPSKEYSKGSLDAE